MVLNKIIKNACYYFEFVDNQYEWGYYFDFKVLIMTQNGYINATKLCRDGGKRFDNWLRNQGSKELIHELTKTYEIRGDEKSIITITGGRNSEVRGTYVH